MPLQPALYASPTKESWNLRIVCRWIAFELPLSDRTSQMISRKYVCFEVVVGAIGCPPQLLGNNLL